MRLASDIPSQPAGVLLLRLTVAGLMLFHGIAKVRGGLDGIQSLLAGAGWPTWLAYGVLIGEIIAPILVLAGVWVRWAALIIAINMIVAIVLAHPSDLFALGDSGGHALELQALFFFGALSIALLANGKHRAGSAGGRWR